MHIEKNVFDCVVGAILGFEGKRHLWDIQSGPSSGRPAYTVSSENKIEILEMLRDVKYPSQYAGSLKSKINMEEKKFVGLKTHDCHVMLERLIPIFIRPYLPTYVVNPVVCLCIWFQRLCCRELTRSDVVRMKADIVLILCHFERIFPRGFFTIMVHLMIHLPDQVMLKGPVHYNWMYPIERQLGEYKKYVRNTRYPEGCIAEQYIVQECVTYVKLYMDYNAPEEPTTEENTIVLNGYIPNMKLSPKERGIAHWCVLEHCDEARPYINYHKEEFGEKYPHRDDKARINHFSPYLNHWLRRLGSSGDFSEYLYALSCEPHGHNFFSQCVVNGVKFVAWDRDSRSLTTQNSGVMVETEDEKYYGVLENVIELIYPNGVTVVVFKCRWFNEDRRSIKRDHGIESVDTSQSWYEDTPYCLASIAKQVFYVDDPKCGDNWKVINKVAQRGIYNARALARDEDASMTSIDNAYQETTPSNIPQVPIRSLHIDLGSLPCAPEELYVMSESEDDEDENNVDQDGEDIDDFDDDHYH